MSIKYDGKDVLISNMSQHEIYIHLNNINSSLTTMMIYIENNKNKIDYYDNNYTKLIIIQFQLLQKAKKDLEHELTTFTCNNYLMIDDFLLINEPLE